MCSTGCNPVPHRRALFPVLDLFNHRSGARSKLARRGEVWELISRDEYAEGEQARPRTTYYLLPTTCYSLTLTTYPSYYLLPHTPDH